MLTMTSTERDRQGHSRPKSNIAMQKNLLRPLGPNRLQQNFTIWILVIVYGIECQVQFQFLLTLLLIGENSITMVISIVILNYHLWFWTFLVVKFNVKLLSTRNISNSGLSMMLLRMNSSFRIYNSPTKKLVFYAVKSQSLRGRFLLAHPVGLISYEVNISSNDLIFHLRLVWPCELQVWS